MAGATAAHRREHHSVLAAAERRLLIWIAERLPLAITSDHLSALGLASMLVVGLGFAAMSVVPGAAWVVVAALAANWFGDSLDGTVARVRRQERPRFGFYVDHVIDLAGTTLLFAGLAFSGLMTPWIAVACLAGYLLLCAESYLATHAVGVFRISSWGVGPTELRILLAVGALRAAGDPYVMVPAIGEQRLFDVGGIAGLAGFAAVFIVTAARNTRALYLLEPIPQARPCQETTAEVILRTSLPSTTTPGGSHAASPKDDGYRVV